MSPRSRGRSGFVSAVLLGWLVAAVAVVLAVLTWVGEDDGTRSAPPPTEAPEVKTLRLALSTAKTENAALRSELDRMLTSTPGRRSAGPAAGGGAAEPADAVADGARTELTARIRDAATRAATAGDDASKREAAMALMHAFQQGPDGFPAVRDAYLTTENPKAKTMLLPTLMFIGGEEARDLVIGEVQTAADPELRRALTMLSVRYASPEQAPKLKDVYLKELGSEDAKLRTAAIRGLRYAKGDDVQAALLEAASDSSEDIRLAAIEALASRPALAEDVRGILANEASPKIREIGECQLLVSGP